MKFYSFDHDLDPMMLILKLDLNMVEMYPNTKNEVQKLKSEQTDRQHYPHTGMVMNGIEQH